MRYTIHNPTSARRVIYDGIEGQQKKIQIAPLETKYDVELAEHIAAGFSDGRDGDASDLWLTLPGNSDAEFETSLPSEQHAYQTSYPTMMQPSETRPPSPPEYERYQAPPVEDYKPRRRRKERKGA